MSTVELRMRIAAQLMAALIQQRLSPNSPDEQIKEVAETAAKMAEALEHAVSRSLSR